MLNYSSRVVIIWKLIILRGFGIEDRGEEQFLWGRRNGGFFWEYVGNKG
jgi:hypothetical protein